MPLSVAVSRRIMGEIIITQHNGLHRLHPLAIMGVTSLICCAVQGARVVSQGGIFPLFLSCYKNMIYALEKSEPFYGSKNSSLPVRGIYKASLPLLLSGALQSHTFYRKGMSPSQRNPFSKPGTSYRTGGMGRVWDCV